MGKNDYTSDSTYMQKYPRPEERRTFEGGGQQAHQNLPGADIVMATVRQNHDGVFGSGSNSFARSFYGWTKGVVVLE